MDTIKTIKYADDIFFANKQQAGEEHLVQTLGKGRVGVYSQEPDGADPMVTTDFLKEVRNLENQVNAQLVKMEDAIHISLLSLLTGDNAFLLSLPGAANTTLVGMIGAAVSGEYFHHNFTPDMSSSDLFGPISAAGIQQGKWTREWSGLANATVALCDEFYKGSGTIQNNTLGIAEERMVSDPHGTYPVPLLLMLGASNEVTGDEPRNATWDRWMYRMDIQYPSCRKDILAIMTAAGGTIPITAQLEPEDIVLVQALVQYMGMHLEAKLYDQMADIINELGGKGIQPSPRRLRGWARAVVAESFLAGRSQPTSKDLMVGQHILWISFDDADIVRKVVGGSSDKERSILMGFASDAEKLRKEYVTIEDMGTLGTKVALVKQIQDRLGAEVRSPEYLQEKVALMDSLGELRTAMLERVAEISLK